MKSVIAQSGNAGISRGSGWESIRGQRAADGERSFVLAPFKRSQKQEVEEMAGRASGGCRIHNR